MADISPPPTPGETTRALERDAIISASNVLLVALLKMNRLIIPAWMKMKRARFVNRASHLDLRLPVTRDDNNGTSCRSRGWKERVRRWRQKRFERRLAQRTERAYGNFWLITITFVTLVFYAGVILGLALSLFDFDRAESIVFAFGLIATAIISESDILLRKKPVAAQAHDDGDGEDGDGDEEDEDGDEHEADGDEDQEVRVGDDGDGDRPARPSTVQPIFASTTSGSRGPLAEAEKLRRRRARKEMQKMKLEEKVIIAKIASKKRIKNAMQQPESPSGGADMQSPANTGQAGSQSGHADTQSPENTGQAGSQSGHADTQSPENTGQAGSQSGHPRNE